jgi:catechol 2,3-dioxygenase-like lactoylglutathione lyase family enzyme
MISGAHAIIYSKDADADRAFLRDVLGLDYVDSGGGWLIFGLPPSEIAVHPTHDTGGSHEVYFLCESIDAFVNDMKARGVPCDPVATLGWGQLTRITLPGGGGIGVYEPRHARPANAAAPSANAAAKAKPAARAKPAAAAAPKAKAKPAAKATVNAKAKAKPVAKAKPPAKPAANAKPKAKSKRR